MISGNLFVSKSDKQYLIFFSSCRQQNINLSTIEETMSLSDISYDKTEEDIYDDSHLRSGRSWKCPSAPPMDLDVTPSGKRKRLHVSFNNSK